MDRDYGCFGFTLMVGAILFSMVFLVGMVLSSIGITPVLDAGGLSWDNSAYIANQQAETTRFVAQTQADTERNRQDNESLRTIFIVVAVFGAIVVVVYQRERTKRHQAELLARQNETKMKLQMYIAYLGMNGKVGTYRGDLGVFDNDRGEFVPAAVALLELGNKGY